MSSFIFSSLIPRVVHSVDTNVWQAPVWTGKLDGLGLREYTTKPETNFVNRVAFKWKLEGKEWTTETGDRREIKGEK